MDRLAFNLQLMKLTQHRRFVSIRSVAACLALLVKLCVIFPAQANMIRDTEIESGIDDLIAPLIAVAGFSPKEIDVRIILDNKVNAFVRSKRRVYVNSGLIESTDDPLLFFGRYGT